jgi:hypothetical protein
MFIFVAFFFSYLLVVWYKTNALVEYANLLKLNFIFRLKEYNDLKKEGYEGVYTDFLNEYYHDYFIVRLLVCPICLSFWLGSLNIVLFSTKEGLFSIPFILFFYLLFNRML